jgi:hypothetical protein
MSKMLNGMELTSRLNVSREDLIHLLLVLEARWHEGSIASDSSVRDHHDHRHGKR